MEDFGYLEILAFSVWILFGIKSMYDDMQLVKAYQKDINSSFRPSPFTENHTVRNPISIMKERWRMVYGRYPEHPEVDRLARRVRRDTVVMFILFILLGFALTAGLQTQPLYVEQ